MSRPGPAQVAVALAALMALSTAACVPAEDIEPMVCENVQAASPDFGIGNMETGFTAIDDGQDIHIVLGPQGLHMIVVSVRLNGFEMPSVGSDRSRVSVAIRHDGQLVGGTYARLAPSRIEGQDVEFLGLRAVFTHEVKPLDGRIASVAIGVTDGCGRDVRVARTLRLSLQ